MPKSARSSTTSVCSKRKSTGGVSSDTDRVKKQPRTTLDAFFSSEVKVPVGYGLDDIARNNTMHVQDVVLSEEQRQVLTMVVEDERSIFFTGSAGNVTHARICIYSHFLF